MSSLPYVPRLDGFRAIAIGTVFVSHFLPSGILTWVGPGGVGVRAFFVLSGYLITRILLRYRASGAPLTSVAATFYRRRLLRLTPAYYLAIAVGTAVGIANLRSDWWIHALYFSNFYVAEVVSGISACETDLTA